MPLPLPEGLERIADRSAKGIESFSDRMFWIAAEPVNDAAARTAWRLLDNWRSIDSCGIRLTELHFGHRSFVPAYRSATANRCPQVHRSWIGMASDDC